MNQPPSLTGRAVFCGKGKGCGFLRREERVRFLRREERGAVGGSGGADSGGWEPTPSPLGFRKNLFFRRIWYDYQKEVLL